MAEREQRKQEYIAVIDQDKVRPEECEKTCVAADPLKRSGRGTGFYFDDAGHLHIDPDEVMEAHKLCAKRCPFDAIQIVKLPAETGQLVHAYGQNGFRLYELPAPVEGNVVGLLGRNGVGKSTALKILAGMLKPNLGHYDEEKSWDEIITEFRGTALQNYLNKLKDSGNSESSLDRANASRSSRGKVQAAYKPQQVDMIPDRYEGNVRDLLQKNDERDALGEVAEQLQVAQLLDRALDELSGGELQRVALAATIVKDADIYLVDEPSSYLDVSQRLRVARVLRGLAQDARVVVVEHDIATLDLLADTLHVVYGEPTGFGVVSQPLSVRKGINQFLSGRLKDQNVQIRPDSIDFLTRKERIVHEDEPVLEFPELEKDFGSFQLATEAGTIYREEVLGIFGQNALGKTTFAKMLAGSLEPDNTTLATHAAISYKPQYIDTDYTGTVRAMLRGAVDIFSQRFETRIKKPFDLEPLYESTVSELSGGELQRVGIALALARDADIYLLDEPSAYLDVDRRVRLAKQLRLFAEKEEATIMVIDHDLLLLDYVADRAMVFEGEPGVEGTGRTPEPIRDGVNRFLATMDLTFRRDPETGRPRANKPGSQKDREQKESGEYYAK